ncbi:hypothetical protein DRJ24_05020 [Candidatus Acetothermia bacterium]|nr:MAG: hypothetical protein DRJ24_05020 [Candidatus Acetothermia bacterium]
MKIGLLTLSFRLEGVDSIKERRSIVKRLLAEVHRLGAAFAACEVRGDGSLRSLKIRVAHLSDDPRYTEAVLTRLERRFERGRDYRLADTEREIL